MINEARTLLMNKPASFFAHDYGNEYVSPSFVPVQLDKNGQLIYSLLFGTNPDELTLNYRVSQYLSLIQSDAFLYHYILELDPRITYSFDKWNDFKFGNRFLQSSSYISVMANTFVGDDFNGHNLTNIDIELTKSGDTWNVDYTCYYPKKANVRTSTNQDTLTITDPVFTDYKLTIAGLSSTPNTSEKINCVICSRPARDLKLIMDALYNSDAHNFDLGLPNTEPYVSFKELGYGGYSPVKRFCATLLRFIYSNKLKMNG